MGTPVRAERGRTTPVGSSPAGFGRGSQPDGAAAGSPFFQSRARTAGTVVVALLLAGGVWVLVGQAADWSHLEHAAGRMAWWWLVVALAGSAAGYLGYAMLLRVMAAVTGGPRMPLRLASGVTVLIFGASVIATSAGRLGSEYWAMRRMHEPPPQAWSRVLAINTALWAFLAALAAAGAVSVLAGAGHAPLWLSLCWLLVPLGAVGPAGYLSSPARRRLTEDRGSRQRRALAAALRGLVLIRAALTERYSATRSVAGGALIWGGELLTLWAALRAFGVTIGFGPLALGYATGFASSMLPLPAGGAGGVDAASAYAMTLVGVPLGPALLATFVQRLCTYWIPLVVALAGARYVRRLSASLARVPAAEAVSAA